MAVRSVGSSQSAGGLSAGTSVADPGTGKLEALLPVQTLTAASHTFVGADLYKETRRSNGGSAMTDTFPASSMTGLTNGTQIQVNNVDATASLTISAGSGTSINSSASVVVGPGRSTKWVYDAPTTTWRSTMNSLTSLLSGQFGTTSGTVMDGADSRVTGAAQKTANLSDLSSAAAGRSNLGLGSLATQAASAVAVTGGAIDGTAVGGTTAAAGKFSTLSASGTVSGAGFTALLASPPSIGATAPGAGAFTTLSATTPLPASSGGTGSTAGALLLTGGTLTGNVTIAPASGTASATFNKAASGSGINLIGQTSGLNRWVNALGNATAESGSNVGSDWTLQRYNDAGTLIDTPLTVARSTGTFAFLYSPTFPTPTANDNSNKGATTGYVDAARAAYLPLAGGQMTGPLQLKVSATVSAAGTTQGTATALAADINVVTTAAASSGVILVATLGQRQEVFNRGANALLVYPPTGAKIEAGSTNAGVSIAVSGHAVFVATSSTQFYQAP